MLVVTYGEYTGDHGFLLPALPGMRSECLRSRLVAAYGMVGRHMNMLGA